MPKYLVSWVIYYSRAGEEEIEASTEEEAIQIAEENIDEYDSKWEVIDAESEIKSLGEVENN